MNTYFVDLGLGSDVLVYAKYVKISSNGIDYLFWLDSDIVASFAINIVKKIERQYWGDDGHIYYEKIA